MRALILLVVLAVLGCSSGKAGDPCAKDVQCGTGLGCLENHCLRFADYPRAKAPEPSKPVQETAPEPETPSLDSYTYSQENAEEHCRATWSKRGELDRGMYSYCLGSQKEGFGNFQKAIAKYRSEDWFPELVEHQWNRWTKRGITDYGTFASQLDLQLDDYLSYQYALKHSNDPEMVRSCAAKNVRWKGSRWSMTMHCVKSEGGSR